MSICVICVLFDNQPQNLYAIRNTQYAIRNTKYGICNNYLLPHLAHRCHRGRNGTDKVNQNKQKIWDRPSEQQKPSSWNQQPQKDTESDGSLYAFASLTWHNTLYQLTNRTPNCPSQHKTNDPSKNSEGENQVTKDQHK